MKYISDLLLHKQWTITRKEYFIANIIILVFCILWVIITSTFLSIVAPDLSIIASVLISSIPMLAFFTYTWLNITWKRWKDFLRTNYLIYFFFIIIVIGTWAPLIFQTLVFSGSEYANYLFHPVVFLFWIILNILWTILWLIFQFTPTKNKWKK